MSTNCKAAFIAVIVFTIIQSGSASTCKREGLFGFTSYINCPESGQPSSHIFCCGSEENRYCCDNVFGDLEIDQETVDKIMESLPKLIGGILAGLFMLVLLCVICCCCCPFCLLAKRRNRGHIHRGGAEVTVSIPQQQAAQPLQPYDERQRAQPYMQPEQTGYPAQQPGYPTQQPGYPAQQPGYPAQQPGYPPVAAAAQPAPGYPMAGHPAPGYPAAQPSPGYPDQPPAYSEKQAAFNPNYPA